MAIVLGIYIARAGAAPMESLDEARVLDHGIEGDRYTAGTGTWSDSPGGGRHVTLIESETLAALARDHGVYVDSGDARRNIVTEGVALNHLVGREFTIGEVVLRGIRLCEPCRELEQATVPGVRVALVHRGGLRADVVRGGTISVGDAIA